MHDPYASVVHRLFILNVGLQLFDGFVTCHYVQRGVPEANPIMHASMMRWGVITALIGWKVLACGLLVFLWTIKNRILAMTALLFTATMYLCFSVGPWLFFVLLP